ncbi:MAG: DUF4267 domain-containing protein [Pseudomonadota bacterium]
MTADKVMNAIVTITGIGLIVIGGRFLVAPDIGEAGFGMTVDTNDNFSYHYIKGIRDLIIGVCFIVLVYYQHSKLLGWNLLLAGVIAATDAWVVMGYNGNSALDAWMHLGALVVCIVTGVYYMRRQNTA